MNTEHVQTTVEYITTRIDHIESTEHFEVSTAEVHGYTSPVLSSTLNVSASTDDDIDNTEQSTAMSTELVPTPPNNCFFPTWSPGIQYEIINQSLFSYLIYTCTEPDTDSRKWGMAHIYMTTCLHNERWWPPIQECSGKFYLCLIVFSNMICLETRLFLYLKIYRIEIEEDSNIIDQILVVEFHYE